eukprot:GHVN01069013.1.p1 GENE.GHVN01069013.1~~GHVN01069013.1.p1  ORF type:complete len:1473 (-),score=334.53 GHVN01069013.1:1520-5938(-)
MPPKMDIEAEASHLMSMYQCGDTAGLTKHLSQFDLSSVEAVMSRSREQGNSHFKKKEYTKAIENYSQALAACETAEVNVKTKVKKEQTSKGGAKDSARSGESNLPPGGLGDSIESTKHVKRALLSNRSACWFNLKVMERSLQDARSCIEVDPTWGKGWFRAARVFYEQEDFDSSAKIFKAALKHSQVDGPDKVNEVQQWLEKSEKLLQRKRMIDRVTVDYSRFADIGEEDEALGVGEGSGVASVAGRSVVEFSDDVPDEQKAALNQMLGIQQDGVSAAAPAEVKVPRFDPRTSFTELPEVPPPRPDGNATQEDMQQRQAFHATCSFLQLQSELRVTHRCLNMLNGHVASLWASSVCSTISHQLTEVDKRHRIIRAVRLPSQSDTPARRPSLTTLTTHPLVLFLGTGTCVPLVAATRVVNRVVSKAKAEATTCVGASEVGALISPVAETRIIANTGHVAPHILQSTLAMLSRNEVPLTSTSSSPPPSQQNSQSPLTPSVPSPEGSPNTLEVEGSKVRETPQPCQVVLSLYHQRHETLTGVGKDSPCGVVGMDLGAINGTSSDHDTDKMEDTTKTDKTEATSGKNQPVTDKTDASLTQVMERELCDVPTPATIVVIDPDLFDSCLIGRRVLNVVRHARKHLSVDRPLVVPAKASISMHLGAIHITPPLAGIDVRPIEAARWSLYPEMVDLTHHDKDDIGTLHSHTSYRPVSESVEVFEFDFAADLKDIDEKIKLRDSREVKFNCIQSDEVNAIIVTFRLHGYSCQDSEARHSVYSKLNPQLLVDTHPTRAYGTPWGQSVEWLDTFTVTKGDEVVVEARHTPTRVMARVTSPLQSPKQLRQGAIPRWQLDVINDTTYMSVWAAAIDREVKARLKIGLDAMDDVELNTQKKNINKKHLEILALGSGPGVIPLMAHLSAARFLAPHVRRPRPSIHVTSTDLVGTHVRCSRQMAKRNATLLVESGVAARQAKRAACLEGGGGWKPIPSSAEGCDDEPRVSEVSKEASVASSKATDEDITMVTDEALGDDCVSTAISEIKSRLTVVEKDFRQLRPPLHLETGETRLALAAAIGAPMGAGGPQLPPSYEDDYLPYLIDLMIAPCFDYGCLGEGILRAVSYARRALMDKRGSVLPERAVVYAACAEMGLKYANVSTPSNSLSSSYMSVDCASWATYRYSAGGEYSGVDLLSERRHLLTDPVEVFSFDFGRAQTLSATNGTPYRGQTDLTLPCVSDGRFNSIVFWFDLDMGVVETDDSCEGVGDGDGGVKKAERLVISSSPHVPHGFDTIDSLSFKDVEPSSVLGQEMRVRGKCKDTKSTRPLTATSSPTSSSSPVHTPSPSAGRRGSAMQRDPLTATTTVKASCYRQAVQMVEEVDVTKGMTLRIGAAHDEDRIMFRVNKHLWPEYESLRTTTPLLDPSWVRLNEVHQKMTHDLTSQIYSNRETNKQAIEAATRLAIDPGKQSSYLIDPQEADRYALTFFL